MIYVYTELLTFPNKGAAQETPLKARPARLKAGSLFRCAGPIFAVCFGWSCVEMYEMPEALSKTWRNPR